MNPKQQVLWQGTDQLTPLHTALTKEDNFNLQTFIVI